MRVGYRGPASLNEFRVSVRGGLNRGNYVNFLLNFKTIKLKKYWLLLL
jgi:hypothetical protein